MPLGTVQPIAGVSANRETQIEAVYPSVAANVLGQLIGVIMGAVASLPILVVRLIVLVVVGSLLLPLGLLVYLLMKVFGSCYVLTNRSIIQRRIIGGRVYKQVPLNEVADVEIVQQRGYEFHRVGDLNLLDAQGNLLLRIPAIQFPDRLEHIVLDLREARMRSDESLAHIQGRS